MAVVNFSFGVPGQPRLFLAGTFPDESVPSVSSTQLRYWDGQAFSLPFGPDFTDGRILAMTVFNGELILAGEFSRIGTLPVSNIVRYSSGLGWRPMGSGTFDGPIYALAELQGELVAAGDFVYSPSGSPTVGHWYAVHWNGSTWREVNSVNSPIYCAALWQGALRLGGRSFLDMYLPSVAQPGGIGIQSGEAYSMTVHEGDLYIGGSLTVQTQSGLARQVVRVSAQNGQWLPLNGGLGGGQPPLFNGAVYTLTSFGGRVWAGGAFSSVAGTPAPRVASWNESSGWSVPSSGPTGPVLAMAPFGSELFVGGSFLGAGTPSSAFLCRYSTLLAPTIQAHPQSGPAAIGGTLDLTVSALIPDGTQPSYQWLHDGAPIADGPGGITPFGGSVSGSRSPSLRVTGFTRRDAGSFVCVVSNGCANVQSSAAQIVATPFCDADFNGDGNLDQDDVANLISVIAGGNCPD